MSVPIGKLTILLGAGIVGSVLAKEGRLPYVSDFVSGAFKIAVKRMSRDDSSTSKSKPRNDSLLAQVKSLREELLILASNRSTTIVTTSETARGRRYGIIILVVVVGYGFVWMKGWKLPDMMFATKRSLSDACGSVARKLENVYSSIAATKRNLSSKMDNVDKSLDECIDLTADTKETLSELRGKSDTFGRDIKSVHHAVQTLENKLWSFEEKQELTNEGVMRLCNYAWNLENGRTTERIQANPSSSSIPAIELPPATPSPRANPSSSSRPAIELPPATPSSRHRSLPLGFSPEALSLSQSNASPNQVQRRPLQNAVSDPGLMTVGGTTEANTLSSSSLDTTTSKENSTSGSTGIEKGNSGFSGLGFLTRTRSAMTAVFRQTRPSVQS